MPILPEDTGADMLKKYTALYVPLIEKVLKAVSEDNLKLISQNEENASYFGKRTPSDGEINWNWDKERIRNWIRAQANPYPGAFSFLNGKKIIIDQVSCSKKVIKETHQNGEIIAVEPKVSVKVNDGVLILERIRTENCNFALGNVLENENRT